MKRLLAITIILFLAFSCGNDSETLILPNSSDRELFALVKEAESLERDINRGLLLNSTTRRDRDGFNSSLKGIKLALRRLSHNPQDNAALDYLYENLNRLNTYQIGNRDRGRVERIRRRFFNKLATLAASQGRRLEDMNYPLFNYNFSQGLHPFATKATAVEWISDVAQDKSHARVSGNDNRAWLISPELDLSKVENPRLRITHLININRNTGRFAADEFDRALILNTAFKAMISTNYRNGDPEKAQWQELELGPMPTSIDFHSVTTPKIDLSAFSAENVSIALVFNMPSKLLGHHYVTWQVNNFEILGASGDFSYIPRPQPLLVHRFDRPKLSPFEVINSIDGVDWQAAQRSGSYRYAKIEGRAKAADSWLVSPTYKLRKIKDPKLIIKHTVRNPHLEKFSALISTDYAGDPETATWNELKVFSQSDYRPDSWIDIITPEIDMEEYLGKEATIAFRYQASEGENTVWEIEEITIFGTGNPIQTKE